MRPDPRSFRRHIWIGFAACVAFLSVACGGDAAKPSTSPGTSAAVTPSASSPAPVVSEAGGAASTEAAPPAAQTGGFDGAKAYDHVAKLVSFGPHPPASAGIHVAQNYIHAQLQSFGCATDKDDFHAQTPIGSLPMENIIAKVPGTGQGIILLLTHYDTLRMDNFVGAEDSGSSTGLMLEMARLLCKEPRQANAVWIAFLDGEEALVDWNKDNDNTYGSRELAARLALSGDLKRVRAVILADMIGQRDLHVLRESSSTKWLTELVWKTAARLGYGDIFLSRESEVEDDHQPFLHRNVSAVDIIDLDDYSQDGFWHTPQDTLDKISARNLAIVGHVILESVKELQEKFH